MKEDGIDISHHTSNNINEYADMEFDYVITVCDSAQENCPYFPAEVKMFHHDFPDLAKAIGTEEEVLAQFRNVRKQIRQFIQTFINENI
jgi:arsenate reductase (thioredoxin)